MFVLRMGAAIFAGILSVLVFSSLAVAQNPDWTRPYIGAQIGYTTNDIEATGEFAALLEGMDDLDGIIGGVQGGANFIQQDGFIFGIVGDFNWTNANDDDDASTSNTSSVSATETQTETIPNMGGKCEVYKDAYNECYDDCNDDCGGEMTVTTTTTTTTTMTTTTNLSAYADIDWKSSIRAKAGFLLQPNLLVYTTGGIAFAKVNIRASKSESVSETIVSTATEDPTETNTVTSASASDDKILTGFVIGGGFEIMVDPNISVFGQALYYKFEDRNFQILGSSFDVELEETTVMAGLSFYFN